MTNVPGPQQPLYFAGKRIAELDFWVPQSGGIGMGVSILSYDGRIQFGVITDAGLVPDPDAIVGRFARRVRQADVAHADEPLGRGRRRRRRAAKPPRDAQTRAKAQRPAASRRAGGAEDPEALQEPLSAAIASISTR